MKGKKEKRLLTNRKIMFFLQTVCQHFFLLRHWPPSAPISLVQFRGHPTQRGSNSKCQRVGLKTSDWREQFKRTASTALKTQHCTCAIAQEELQCTANERGTRQALDTFHQHSCFQYSDVLVVFPVLRLTVFRWLLLSRSHGTSFEQRRTQS